MEQTDYTQFENRGNEEKSSMPFLDHLEELRKRLIYAFLGLLLTTAASFYFAEQIMEFFVQPVGDIKLHVTEVTGSFYAYLKVSLITGALAATPFVFYQLWMFISPGLYPREKQAVLPLVMVSTGLFLVGAAFCYFVVLPFSLQFLIGFGGELLSPIITVGSYISFAGMLMLAFGISFQLPIVAYFLGKVGIVSSSLLARGRRYAVVIILIIAAILTPTTDVLTMSLLAGPLYILYEMSILIVRLTGRRE